MASAPEMIATHSATNCSHSFALATKAVPVEATAVPAIICSWALYMKFMLLYLTTEVYQYEPELIIEVARVRADIYTKAVGAN